MFQLYGVVVQNLSHWVCVAHLMDRQPTEKKNILFYMTNNNKQLKWDISELLTSISKFNKYIATKKKWEYVKDKSIGYTFKFIWDKNKSGTRESFTLQNCFAV